MIVIIILCLLLIIIIINYTNCKENYSENIPKIIWSFWDNPELPEFVKKCQQNWKKYAPNYEIKLLNKNNITEYVDMPNNWHDLPAYRISDVLRLKLLEKYGGIWMDASILLLDNPDNFVEGDITLFTTPTTTSKNPIFENWFIASSKGNEIIKKWSNEVLYALINDNIYIDLSSKYNKDLVEDPKYLICHLVLRNIYDRDKNLFSNIKLYNSSDTAFYQHIKCNWDIWGNNNIFNNFTFDPKRLLIKIRGCDRNDNLQIPNILL
jgi:hypothetical protein